MSPEEVLLPRQPLMDYFSRIYDECREKASDMDSERRMPSYVALLSEIRQLRDVLMEYEIGEHRINH